MKTTSAVFKIIIGGKKEILLTSSIPLTPEPFRLKVKEKIETPLGKSQEIISTLEPSPQALQAQEPAAILGGSGVQCSGKENSSDRTRRKWKRPFEG